ncbi:septum site-determining protein Ssd [Actinopolymorpha alba]|uniref:septum site-determining protein Ssd n=1 Tax=Actinopolymorpha alba TaxID=533267 RepID=UPI000376F785|nr:septum site-determining protein Ssd [Actinopolymorpha alba]
MSALPPPAHPLAVTADLTLLDDLVRLATAGGVALDVANDVGSSRRAWTSAPLVLVGADLVADLARAAPPRRRDLLIVSHDINERGLWEGAVALGAEHVLSLPDAERWLVSRLADTVDGATRESATVCVLGGRGGAGASTLATALAVTAIRLGRISYLIDGDPLGGGIDLVLGGEDSAGMRWPDLVATEGRVSSGALRSALPLVEGLVVLSWDRGDLLTIPRPAMRTVLSAARRGGDLVVVDLPRHTTEAAEEALSQCTTALLVVPAEVRAVAAASRVARTLTTVAPDVRLVVRGPAPSGLDGRTVAATLDLPLAGEIAAEPRLDLMLERGQAPARHGKGPLAAFCRSLLTDLGVLPADRSGTAA